MTTTTTRVTAAREFGDATATTDHRTTNCEGIDDKGITKRPNDRTHNRPTERSSMAIGQPQLTTNDEWRTTTTVTAATNERHCDGNNVARNNDDDDDDDNNERTNERTNEGR